MWVTSAGTAITGLGFFWTKYLLEPSEPWAVINHPLQPWLLKAHLLFAPGLVFAVGLITTRHIWRHFRSGTRAGRRSGIGAGLTVGPMILSGYLIQTVVHEEWLRIVAWLHIVTSVVYTLALLFHQPIARRPDGVRPTRRRRLTVNFGGRVHTARAERPAHAARPLH